MTGVQSGIVPHLLELRGRLLRSGIVVAAIFIMLLPAAQPVYTTLARPLLKHMPENGTMVAIDVAAPLLVPYKLLMVLALAVAAPYLLHQLWAFISPGLYRRERRFALPLLVTSVVLFYLGIAFAYFAVFPLIFGFLIGVAPTGVTVMTDIGRYLDFTLMLFLAFGMAFETPVATVLLTLTGVTNPAQLSRIRPYVIVAVFIFGMLLTPPDVVSQILLAIPMWLLYEIGVIWSRLLVRPEPETAS